MKVGVYYILFKNNVDTDIYDVGIEYRTLLSASAASCSPTTSLRGLDLLIFVGHHDDVGLFGMKPILIYLRCVNSAAGRNWFEKVTILKSYSK